MTDIGGGCYMVQSDKGQPPLRITKLSKNHKKGRMKFKKNYMKLISCGMIGNSNCIGTKFNGLILNLTQKEINPLCFFKNVLQR